MQYGLVHISVGDLLREQVAAGTGPGQTAKQYMDSGNLVPDEVVVQMVVDRLSQDDIKQHGWLLDGYPRSRSQAEAIIKENIEPDVFLLINVPERVIVDRVTGRRTDPETGDIYHMTFRPPPSDIEHRLVQVRQCNSVCSWRGCNNMYGGDGSCTCMCSKGRGKWWPHQPVQALQRNVAPCSWQDAHLITRVRAACDGRQTLSSLASCIGYMQYLSAIT